MTDRAALAADPPAAFRVLRLKRREERRLLEGHLWVFSNEVDTEATPLGQFAPGELIELRSDRERFLGYGYVNPHSLISARILSRDPHDPPSPALYARRMRSALALRERTHSSPHYRLVYGESDGLPGLVIDRYGEICVAQIGTAGMEEQAESLLDALGEVLAPEGVLLKNDSVARDLEGLPHEVRVARGRVPERVEVLEAGLAFSVPLGTGQKTGWYYDQTENRAQFLKLTQGAKRILDVCGYVGAWGLRAAAGTDAEVTLIDASASALATAQANARRLGVRLKTIESDAFAGLADLQGAGPGYDLVILDPPAFVKRRKDLARGTAAYRRLNQLAMKLLSADAFLVTCSCSYHLEPAAFTAAVAQAALHAGRTAQILASGGQSPDHPVHPSIPETRYLKALLLRVT